MTTEAQIHARIEAELRTEIEQSNHLYNDLLNKYDEARAEREQYRDALRRIEEWSQAYPLAIFPKPDLHRAHQLLQAGGMTIDSISADAMRHVVEGVGKIARAALSSESPSDSEATEALGEEEP